MYRHSMLRVVFLSMVFLLAALSFSYAGEGEFSANVAGTDAIFLSGRTDVIIPAPGGYDPSFPLTRHGFVLQDFLKETFPKSVAAKAGMVFKFNAAGWVHYYNGAGNGSGFLPDGEASGYSNLYSLGGISGYQGPQGPLVGVFLNNNDPTGAPPAMLNFWANGTGTSFQTLSPQLGQVFFIGNGYTPDGIQQTFIAPEGATRLFLGIADGFGFMYGPGAYEDNDGSFSVQASYALPNCLEFPAGAIDRACFYDDFNDNSVNAALWTSSTGGLGPVLTETEKRAEIFFPTNPSNNGAAGFSAGLVSTCRLRGDFDVQADFSLLTWPAGNGVRVALSAAAGPTERVSFGNYYYDYPGQPREVYLTHFSDGVLGIKATTDLTGKFRMVRTGSTATGYHYADGAWVPIHTGPAITADAAFSLSAWSHDYVFTGQEVKAAFDNVIINKGTLICNNRPPVAKAAATPAECSGMNETPVVLDGSGSSDPDGDSLSYTWTWAGGSATGVSPAVLLPFGTTSVTLTVSDNKGGTASDTISVTVQDSTAPTTTASVNGTAGQNGWYVSNVTVTLNATDTCTGVKEIHYTINGTETVVSGSTAGFTLSNDGSYLITYWAVDNNGTAGSRGSTSVDRDAAPPVTTPTVPAPPSDGNGSYRSCVPVTLTTTAGLSGVSEVVYSVDGGQTWLPYTGQFTVCSSGETTVTYKAVSNAGNVEQPKTLVINIDLTPPAISANVSVPANAYGWNNTDVTVSWTCSDSGSGIASCPTPTTVWTEGAGQVITGEAVDKAGNKATATILLNIDKTVPSITAAISPVPNALGWNNSDATVTFTCSDGGSGNATCTGPVVVTTEGQGQSVIGTVTDKAGNTASTSVTVNLDKTAPAITITGVTDGATYPACSAPTPAFTATDALSGMLSQQGVLTGGNANGVNAYTYTVTAVDKAGLTAIATAAYRVAYDFGGFIAPVTLAKPFKKGSTIPAKFTLSDGCGNSVTSANATLSLSVLSSATPDTEPIVVSSNVPDSGNAFRYSGSDGVYIYNLATDDLAAGTYLATVTTDDGLARTVTIQIKQ